jgi:hypothetical protein
MFVQELRRPCSGGTVATDRRRLQLDGVTVDGNVGVVDAGGVGGEEHGIAGEERQPRQRAARDGIGTVIQVALAVRPSDPELASDHPHEDPTGGSGLRGCLVACNVLALIRQAVVFVPTAFSIHAPPSMMPPRAGCVTLRGIVTSEIVAPVRGSRRAM